MTRAQTAAIEAAVIDVLNRTPMTITEVAVELHRRDAIPVYWDYGNVAAVMRRLYFRGALSRLDTTSTRTVLWWAA